METGADKNDSSYIGFNQNFSSLAIGKEGNFKVYNVQSRDTLELQSNLEWNDIYVFERLFGTFISAIVTKRSPKIVTIYSLNENKDLYFFKSIDDVVSVKLNFQRMVVCSSNALQIYDLQAVKELHVIRDTPSNHLGVIAVSSRENQYLAYPGSSIDGTVHVFDMDNMRAVAVIPAHRSLIAALSFNTQGNLLATASERGTVIRIFVPGTSEKIMEFRRGTIPASICSLSFSLDSEYLACSSNSRTVHVFKLNEDGDNQELAAASDASWWGFVGGVIQNSATMLQNSASYLTGDMLTPLKRSFALAYLPQVYQKTACAILSYKKCPVLLVATVDGWLHSYMIDTVNGGECRAIKEQKFCALESDNSEFEVHNNIELIVENAGMRTPERANETTCEEPTSGSSEADSQEQHKLRVKLSFDDNGCTASPILLAYVMKPDADEETDATVDKEPIRCELQEEVTKLELPPGVDLIDFCSELGNETRQLPESCGEDDHLEYAPIPRQSYASVVVNKRVFDSPEERKAEAEAALRDAVDGEGNAARRI